mgnify:FL=1
MTNGLKCPAIEEEFEDFEDVKLYAAQPKTLPASNPKRVVVARPEIADVYSVSTNEVVLEPKTAGTTTLFIWDDYGQHSYQLKVFRDDLSNIKQRADNLIRELKIAGITTKINEDEGKLILAGEVNDLNEKERLLSALGDLKEKVLDFVTIKEERTLIQIDAQILEINRDNLKNLGLEYQTSVSLTDDANKKMNHITDMFATSMWTRGKLDVTLNMLIKQSKARILSQPKLVCLSGKEAEFLVGGQVPVVTNSLSGSGSGTTSNVVYKDYGITLNIKPTVKENSNIFFNILTEVKDIDTANSFQVTSLGINAPAFATRNAKTDLYLKNGQSVVIAGLIKNKDSDTVKKFPFLGDVPVLGMLWRSRDFQNKQTELVILLTPTIVSGSPALTGKNISSEVSPRENKARKALREFRGGETIENSASSDDKKTYSSGLDSYIDDIKSQIVSSVGYPSLARELGVAGTVKVRLRISSDGGLKEALVVNSSGSELLDSSTIRSIKKLAPFPSFPGSIERNEIAVDIPIVYN